MRKRASVSKGLGLVGSTCITGLMAGTAAAQNAPAPAPANPPLEEIVVTGFRASLQSSTEAKRDATGFTDSIFAEDIGKFPDSNIAESFNRIPGITITRDISGEGVNIAIRGLGQNFTRVLLNNAPVAVASTGRTDAQSTNREVDLDLFPTELFTQLTVRKSSAANMLEGGAAGTVNMRSARPFDTAGRHISFGLQGTDSSTADSYGKRGSLLASNTWGDTFGALIGIAGVRNQVRTPGYETVGWTNPNITGAQCPANTTCNSTGGGNFTIPSTVPTNAGNGLTAGAPIDSAFLLAHNPGLTLQQIDNAIIPRLSRPVDDFGTKDRYNGIVSFEYRPTEALHFFLDSMYGKKDNDLQRIDMNWVGRNGGPIPLNMQVDRADCSQGCVVTKATYANAQFFLEYRPYLETTEFWGANPGFEWQLNDAWKLDVNANKTHSWFHRESPSVLAITTANSGLTVDYTNNGTPVVNSNVDLNNPANFNWPGARVNIQDERRTTETKGARMNLSWAKWEAANFHVGAAYDDVQRQIFGFDNSQAWQNAVCGDNPTVFLRAPNTQPPCEGLVNTNTATLPANYPRYPAYGTGFTAGQTTPIAYQGSLIPASMFQSYLQPGPDGFITLDWDRFKKDAQYDAFHDSAPRSGGTNTGASGGLVREKITGAYFEITGQTDVNERQLRYTAGIRRVRTEQSIGGLVSIADPRNAEITDTTVTPNLNRGNDPKFDGSRFPNIDDFNVQFDNTYYNTLPSFEVAYSLTDQALLRGAASRTMTRPDPNAMLPGLNFSSPSADTGTVGNTALEPFISENLDLGFEYYTGHEGYWGIAAFRKRVTGFTVNGIKTVPFTDLAAFGVTFDTLTPTQQTNINARGGPNSAFVNLTQQVNASGALTVNGLELNWVQPLDALVGRWGLDGLGFAANLTLINQSGKGAAPAIAVGVAPHTYNLTLYYENHGISARLAETFTAGSQVSGLNQNGIPAAAFIADDYEQWDFSSSLDLSHFFDWQTKLEVTFDAINLFNKKQRTEFQFNNAPQTIYEPGRQLLLGVRGRF